MFKKREPKSEVSMAELLATRAQLSRNGSIADRFMRMDPLPTTEPSPADVEAIGRLLERTPTGDPSTPRRLLMDMPASVRTVSVMVPLRGSRRTSARGRLRALAHALWNKRR